MAVTKDYGARNYGARDLIVESMGLTAGILTAVFVLLVFAGALDPGRGISVTVNQPTVQTPSGAADN
jgi:hypothetical protein